MPNPIALTDAQLDAVMRAASPLAVCDRDRLLQEVAAALKEEKRARRKAGPRWVRPVRMESA